MVLNQTVTGNSSTSISADTCEQINNSPHSHCPSIPINQFKINRHHQVQQRAEFCSGLYLLLALLSFPQTSLSLPPPKTAASAHLRWRSARGTSGLHTQLIFTRRSTKWGESFYYLFACLKPSLSKTEQNRRTELNSSHWLRNKVGSPFFTSFSSKYPCMKYSCLMSHDHELCDFPFAFHINTSCKMRFLLHIQNVYPDPDCANNPAGYQVFKCDIQMIEDGQICECEQSYQSKEKVGKP